MFIWKRADKRYDMKNDMLLHRYLELYWYFLLSLYFNLLLKPNDSIIDICVTACEIVDIIQILDLKKASGPDKISHKMLKIAPEKIAEPPQIIFNKSLRQGKYPSSWKIAHRDSYFKKRWCLLAFKLPSDIFIKLCW